MIQGHAANRDERSVDVSFANFGRGSVMLEKLIEENPRQTADPDHIAVHAGKEEKGS